MNARAAGGSSRADDLPVDEAGTLSVRAVSARRCPNSDDADASFAPTELRSVDAADASLGTLELASVCLTCIGPKQIRSRLVARSGHALLTH